jgi:hypothetical protein
MEAIRNWRIFPFSRRVKLECQGSSSSDSYQVCNGKQWCIAVHCTMISLDIVRRELRCSLSVASPGLHWTINKGLTDFAIYAEREREEKRGTEEEDNAEVVRTIHYGEESFCHRQPPLIRDARKWEQSTGGSRLSFFIGIAQGWATDKWSIRYI